MKITKLKFSIQGFGVPRSFFLFLKLLGCPNTSRVDCFSVSWKGENNYLVPPVSLVVETLHHLKASEGVGVLIIPRWTSSPFWPIISCNDTLLFNSFVKDYRIFHNSTECVTLGNNKSSLIGSEKFKSSIIAIQLNFTLHEE